MLAKDLDKGLKVVDTSSADGNDNDDDEHSYYLPPQRIPVYKTYQKVGQVYERTIHDRTWDWWINLVSAEPVANQEIKKVISQIYRTKDQATGSEYLFYNVELSGNDWKGNRKDFSYMEGVVEGMPIFNYEKSPSNNKIISGTTQVLEIVKEYTIPFKKEKVEELSIWFKNPLSCIVIASDGRKYSCSLDEFRDMPYNELVKEKTGLNEYFRNKRGSKVYS
jgi:hypothetical protein